MQTNPNTMKAPDPCVCVTGKVRLSYAHLTKPHKNNLRTDSKERYSVTLLISKNDAATIQRIQAGIEAAAQAATPKTWGGVRPPQIAYPVHDGDGVKQDGTAYGDECRGCYVMTAATDTKPRVVDINLQDTLDESQIYSGMYARVSVRFFGYFNSGKKGIGCGLNNVQKVADGDPLVNRSSAEEEFGAPGMAGPAVGAAPAYPGIPSPMVPPANPYGTFQQPPMQGAPMGYPPTAPQGYYPPQAYTPQPPAAQPTQTTPTDPLTGQPYVGNVMGIPNPNAGMPF